MPHDWIVPDWPAPAHVRAICTTRSGGISQGPYKSMNPADHVNDFVQDVAENRLLLQQSLALDSSPHWLQQIHSTKILDLDHKAHDFRADGSTTKHVDTHCVVMTADCLPVLLTDSNGQRVTAIHAGWRGLANGILEVGVQQFNEKQNVLAWLGPAIGPEKFEVGEEVIDMLAAGVKIKAGWYKPSPNNGKWLVDLYALARFRLQQAGVNDIYGGGFCTFSDEKRFFSYRRQGECGRMATLIWRHQQADDGQTSPS
jgi:YfiH family protein